MILYANNVTGEIESAIYGRIHGKDHLKMWAGDKTKTFRIVVQWKPYKFYDKDKNIIPPECFDPLYENGDQIVVAADFKPDHKQEELFMELDKNPQLIKQFKVDLKTYQLVRK